MGFFASHVISNARGVHWNHLVFNLSIARPVFLRYGITGAGRMWKADNKYVVEAACNVCGQGRIVTSTQAVLGACMIKEELI
jgi:hypothetical protein